MKTTCITGDFFRAVNAMGVSMGLPSMIEAAKCDLPDWELELLNGGEYCAIGKGGVSATLYGDATRIQAIRLTGIDETTPLALVLDVFKLVAVHVKAAEAAYRKAMATAYMDGCRQG